jgi:predicted phage-related endonuclease
MQAQRVADQAENSRTVPLTKQREDMHMSQAEIITTITELQELRRLQEELEAEIQATQDKIKAAMGDAEELRAGVFKVTYKTVTSSRLDTTALKKFLPEVAERFMKTTTTKRFQVQ